MKENDLLSGSGKRMFPWRGIATLAIPVVLLLLPAPTGLPLHAWRYFAVFAGVILGLVLEPLPGAAVGLIGVTLIAAFSRFFLFSAQQMAAPGFRPPDAGLNWALSGFVDHTVWLIFAAFMFALGYEKTQLGKRLALLLVRIMGKRTLTLGYSIMLADFLLAPVTPSSTARSGGILFPILSNLPPLYGSKPNEPSRRKLGAYVMWLGIVAVCVTSSLFMTGLAPNLLSAQLAFKVTGSQITWGQWFLGFLPLGVLFLVGAPLLAYWIYPPEVKEGNEVAAWASKELEKMGGFSRQQITLALLVFSALLVWIFGGHFIDATTAALGLICLMLLTGVLSEGDIMANKGAWRTFVWFATLIDMADGLNRVGFVKWFAGLVGAHLVGLPPIAAMLGLLVVYFLSHYLFASVTAHATALLPVMLAVGAGIPGIPLPQFALLLCLELGIMGVISPFGCGSSPIYYGSGYISSAEFWKLGSIFGAIFLLCFLALDVPWVLFLARHGF